MNKKIIKRTFIAIISLPFLPISLLMYLYGYRRALIFTGRIGHLALEPDTLLKAERLNLIKTQKWIIIAQKHQVANQHLLNYWKPYFIIIQSPLFSILMKCLTSWKFMQFDATYFVNSDQGAQYSYEVNKRWGKDREPILKISHEDELYANNTLRKLGIPDNAWFVCIHAREGGFSPSDEHLHSYRNSNINDLIPSIKEITERGGWVIRLGDPTTTPLVPMDRVIDYAHHELRSPRMDIILCAKARFILGNTSGIFLVGSIFGTPSVLVNMIPFSALGFSCHDISIPKLMKNKDSNKYLSFNQIMKSDMASYRYSYLYEKDNVAIEENTPEDIHAAVKEMFDELDGQTTDSPLDTQRNDKLMRLFNPNHYGYNAGSRMGYAFLKKYEHLLHD